MGHRNAPTEVTVRILKRVRLGRSTENITMCVKMLRKVQSHQFGMKLRKLVLCLSTTMHRIVTKDLKLQRFKSLDRKTMGSKECLLIAFWNTNNCIVIFQQKLSLVMSPIFISTTSTIIAFGVSKIHE